MYFLRVCTRYQLVFVGTFFDFAIENRYKKSRIYLAKVFSLFKLKN